MTFWYVASPYSHPDPAIRLSRCEAAQRFCAWGFRHRIHLFSPIAHWHPIAEMESLPTDAESFWALNQAMLQSAFGVVVLMLPGWEESKGVKQEVKFAKEKSYYERAAIRYARPIPEGEGYGFIWKP